MTPPEGSRSESKLQIVKLLPANPEEVFAAWLDPDGIKEWLCPGSVSTTVAELDARVGGRFKIVMRNEGIDYVHTGEYLKIDPPKNLVFTWVSDLTDNEASLVTIELRKKGNGTELVLSHEKLPHEESKNKHGGGWNSILDKLVRFLSGKLGNGRIEKWR